MAITNDDDDAIDAEIIEAEVVDDNNDIAETEHDDYVDEERRGFIRRVVVGGLAAITLGSGAAVATNAITRSRNPQVVVLPNGTDLENATVEDINLLVDRIAELEGQLASTRAERDQALSDLNSVTRERDNFQAELSECQEVVSLWEQHDRVGLDDIIVTSLGLLAPMLVALLALTQNKILPAILRLRATFARILANFPSPIEGIKWLTQKNSVFRERIAAIREQVTEAVEPVDQFAELVSDFIIWVLDRLPFGAGDTAKAGLESLRNTVNLLPEFIDGVQEQVLEPLGTWFSDSDDENLRGTVLLPTVDDVFDPVDDLLADLIDFGENFTTNFREPTESAIAEREALRSEISERTNAMRSRYGKA